MLIGLVGKPSSGKSTFFRAATLAEAEIANYPFTTIKPNHGVAYVKVDCVDKEFKKQCNPRFGYCLQGWRFVPVDLMDVAGLVPGAHKGLGKGNQFLDDLRQADVLIHVVDVSGSTNDQGEPVEPGTHDPAQDILFLEEELDLWYLGILKKGWERFARQVLQENQEIDKALGKQLSALKVTEEMAKEVIQKLNLNKDKPNQWTDQQLKSLATEFRKRTKPTIIACNKIDIKTGQENFEKIQKQFPDRLTIPCSAEVELALREAAKNKLIEYIPGEEHFKITNQNLDEDKKKGLDFMKKFLEKFKTPGIQEVLDKAVFDFLKYFAVFPVENSKLTDKSGNLLPDVHLLPQESTALDLAFQIHTDIGEGFIRAIDVKTKRTIGKEHKLKHRDVVEIITRK
ncbi:MAG: redox-regulated ATPase YchF [Nanoarchaeota archaeon]|nr:redox-regulated ATPase YchF [Nanoarchaeota archaeon]